MYKKVERLLERFLKLRDSWVGIIKDCESLPTIETEASKKQFFVKQCVISWYNNLQQSLTNYRSSFYNTNKIIDHKNDSNVSIPSYMKQHVYYASFFISITFISSL